MIGFQAIFFSAGFFLTALSLAMLVPMTVDFFHNDINWQGFGFSSMITLLCGLLLVLANRTRERMVLSVRDTFLLTTINWVLVSLFAALPFIFTHSTHSLTDSFFEAISGLTTTGATVIDRLDLTSPGVLLWRSLLQWLGGIGIVLMALTVMPLLRIGGMQLFRSEFSDRSEKILPKVSQIATAIFGTYVFFTGLCLILLWTAGMTFFDATCHAFATLSTGGFSSHNSSIQYFHNPWIEGILVIFMIVGATTLTLFARLFQGDFKTLLKDQQFRAMMKIILAASIGATLWDWNHGEEFLMALRTQVFHVTSVLTTTGYATTEYQMLSSFSAMMLFCLVIVGGCTGSTSGGIKIFRFQIMASTIRTQLLQLRRPHGVFVPLYNGKPIPEGIFLSVFTFFSLFLICFGALAFSLSLYDLDLIVCLSAAASVLNNVGTTFDPVLGPAGTFSSMPDGAKILLMGGMILGRLEYVTVIILLSPQFWRD